MKTAVVIVAARDAARWLGQSMMSIAAQSLPRQWTLRILLGVDACSSTFATAAALGIPNLQVAYFPEHVGPFIIFNSLACQTRFDVLVRFDADDIMLDGYLASQLERFESPSQALITQTWSIYVNENLCPTRSILANGKTTAPDGRRARASDGQFAMSARVWERLGSFRAWWCHGDSEFLRRAEWAGIAKVTIPRYLYLRRMHPESLTQSRRTGYLSGWRKHYGWQIAESEKLYSRGRLPERIHPAVAREFQTVVPWT